MSTQVAILARMIQFLSRRLVFTRGVSEAAFIWSAIIADSVEGADDAGEPSPVVSIFRSRTIILRARCELNPCSPENLTGLF